MTRQQPASAAAALAAPQQSCQTTALLSLERIMPMRFRVPLVLIVTLSSCASPSSHRCVYLLGRFTVPLNRSMLAQSLTDRGHTVVSMLTSDVDLVVVGYSPVSEDGTGFVPVEELPEYSAAKARGIEILDKATAVRFNLGQ